MQYSYWPENVGCMYRYSKTGIFFTVDEDGTAIVRRPNEYIPNEVKVALYRCLENGVPLKNAVADLRAGLVHGQQPQPWTPGHLPETTLECSRTIFATFFYRLVLNYRMM